MSDVQEGEGETINSTEQPSLATEDAVATPEHVGQQRGDLDPGHLEDNGDNTPPDAYPVVEEEAEHVDPAAPTPPPADMHAADLPPAAEPLPQPAEGEGGQQQKGEEEEQQKVHHAEEQQHTQPHPVPHAGHQQLGAPVQGGRQAATSSSRCADSNILTFSGPPYVPKAKPYKRMDYSHSANALMKIAHDNQLLVSHLTTISKAAPAWTKDANAPPAPGNTASSAINRRKQATITAQENHALYQRLVGIRPSKDISRETLEAQHRQNETYRINCAQFKSGKATAAH